MEIEMQTLGLRSDEGLVCIKCGRPASFLCPLGVLCPTDALIAATRHGWIPTHIRDGYPEPVSPPIPTDDV
jgi:hypothetical protein